jgi:hypothetical protein
VPTIGRGPQLSLATGGAQKAAPWHDPSAGTTMSVPMHPEITGSVSSLTTTLKEHVAIFPEPSVAVYNTTVVPNGNTSPGSWELVKLASEQLSPAVGAAQFTTCSHEPLALTMISIDRQPEMTGFTLSCTITLNVQVDVFPEPSVAVYVTAVVPNGKVSPGLCVPPKVDRLQLSVADGAVQFAVAWQEALAKTTISETMQPVNTGSVVSSTTTLKVQVAVLPAASTAV